MNIIRSFLIKQLLLTIIEIGVLLSLVVIGFGEYLQLVQQQKTTVVQQFVANHGNNDPRLLSRQLDKAFEFRSVTIEQSNGTSLYQSPAHDEPQAISYLLLNTFALIPATASVDNSDLNITIRFDINLTNELLFFDKLLAIIIAVALGLWLLSILTITVGIKSTFSKVSVRISDTISQFITLAGNPPADQEASNPQQVNWSAIPAGFATVVTAIKQLGAFVDDQVDELKSSTEKLKSEAFTDNLTGLPNRNRFIQYFEAQLRETDSLKFGTLTITRCCELQHINQTRGYQEGDKYITDIMALLKTCAGSYDKGEIYRLNGADFACILPNTTVKQAEDFADTLQAKLNEYQRLAEIDSVAYSGIIDYKPGKPLGEILALADTAISIAQTKTDNGWYRQKESDIQDSNSASYGNQNWRQVIDDVLDNHRVSLMHQQIKPSKHGGKSYSEVLTRFMTSEDQVLPTASFLAMAEKLDKIAQIDRMIIETTLALIKKQNLSKQSFGINITSKTVHDEQFMIWLERRLVKEPTIAAKLVFEVSEHGLQQNIKASKRFIDMAHRVGSRITVERFGVGLTSFKFFRDLKPDFIKMDGTYTRNIDEDQNNQYFMRLMVDLAHRIGVGVFAESVETQEEKHVLESLFVDGTQGYFIGKPEPF
ncbi:MAG: diguanylate cyclase (GGDEF)-like protein [Phenylobacterium sp.]|jgi:diguanylate cyclase (GGDEF)-like protein